MTAAERAAAGVGDGLIRLSIGLEHIDDITADLARGSRQPQRDRLGA